MKEFDDDLVYELMNIKDKGAFKAYSYFDTSDNLTELQDNNPEWHKVVED